MAEQKERNSSIELYRVMLMLGICILHCITLGTKRAHPLAGVLMCCVPGFVFISGWFGVKFSPSKVIRLFGIGLYCALVAVGVNFLLGIVPNSSSYWAQVIELWTNGFWFLNAYVALMMLAPMVNIAVSAGGWGKMMSYLFPLLIFVFGWSYVCGAPVLHKLPWPKTVGMGSNTALTLLGIYAFGRVCRVMKVDERLNNRQLLVIALVCVPFVMIGFGNYHSIFSSLLAMAAFVWISRRRLPKWLNRIILYVAPSMFSVYLLHSTRYGFVIIERVENCLHIPMIMNAIVIGSTVFLICVCIDVVRRVFLIPTFSARLLNSLDSFYDRMLERFHV